MNTRTIQRFESTIKNMLQVLLEDLINGVRQERAGWRLPADFGIESADQTELLKEDIIERNARDQFRFNFRNQRVREELSEFNLQFEQLDNFLQDAKKIKKSQEILKQFEQMLQSTPENWKYITALGWWKMLEVSEMPARVDDFLKEGFSPKDWMIKAPRSSSQLALNIAEKYGKIDDFKEVVNFLEKMEICNTQKIALPLTVNQDDVQKIMKVLKWGDIERELTESSIKMLALLWAFLFILKCSNSLPVSTEFSLKSYEIVWNSLENLLREKQLDLLNNLGNTIKALTAKRIIWASDMLHLPEVI